MQLERFSGEWWNRYTKVDMATGCINWTGTRCKEGRGRMWYNGRAGVPVYRVVYEQCYGTVERTLKVCHTCDNPSCLNPYHLFVGTQRDNLRDMFAKGRARPRGRIPRRKKPVAAAVAPSELLSQSSNNGVTTTDIVHLIRTEDVPKEPVAPWRTVLGVPPVQPTQAVQLWKRPREWTGNQQLNKGSAPWCADAAPPVLPALRRSLRRA